MPYFIGDLAADVRTLAEQASKGEISPDDAIRDIKAVVDHFDETQEGC